MLSTASFDASRDSSHGIIINNFVPNNADRLVDGNGSDGDTISTIDQKPTTLKVCASIPSTPLPSSASKRKEPLQPSSLARSLHVSLQSHARSPSDNTFPVYQQQKTTVMELFGWTVGDCLGEFNATYYRIPGQFFIATRALLFYSNWLGFERRFCLTLNDIDAIHSYRNTSIKIVMVDCEEYIFKKFDDRDAVVKVLQELLRRVQLGEDCGHGVLATFSLPCHVQSSMGLDNQDSNATPRKSEDDADQAKEPPAMSINGNVMLGGKIIEHCAFQKEALGRPRLSSDNTLIDAVHQFSDIQPCRRRALSVPVAIAHTEICEEKGFVLAPNIIRNFTPLLDPNERLYSSSDLGTRTVSPPRLLRKSRTTSLDNKTSNISLMPPSARSNVDSQQTVSRSAQSLFDNWLKENESYENIALETTELPCTDAALFFDLFFHDSAPASLAKYQNEIIGDKNVEFSLWNTTNLSDDVQLLERKIEYIHPLKNSMGPSEAKTRRKQQLWRYGTYAVVIRNTTTVEGIPMADCFQVHDLWILKPDKSVDGHSLTLTVSFQVDFLKRTMFKSLIQKNIQAETKKWFQGYVEMLRVALEVNNTTKESPLIPVLSAKDSTDADGQYQDKAKSQDEGGDDSLSKGELRSVGASTVINAIPLFDWDMFVKGVALVFLTILILQVTHLQNQLSALEIHLVELQLQNSKLLQYVSLMAATMDKGDT